MGAISATDIISIPFTPLSNTTISPYIAWSIPYTVAIPSPTHITLPVSRLASSQLKFSISLWIME